MNSKHLLPSWNTATKPFRHTWKRIGNIDQFRWFSRADVLSQLRMAHDELGVRHVRAVAMYSPDMRVWDADLADWHRMGAPAYPTPAQITALRQGNFLKSATDLVFEKTASGYEACFTMERPGVALLLTD